MLIKKIANIFGITGLLFAMDSLLGLQLHLPVSYKTVLVIIGSIYFIFCLWQNKKNLELITSKAIENKNNFLVLELFLLNGIIYFLSQEFFLLVLPAEHSLNEFLNRLNKNLFFYLTLFSGLVLTMAQKIELKKTIEPPNKIVVGLVLLFLLVVGASLRGYKLGAENIKGDEFQVVSAAAGYLHTGEYYSWDWVKNEITCVDCFYRRAWPHTWMVAQSYRNFGVSEFSARLPSVVLGTLTILIVYGFSYFITRNSTLSLTIAALTTLNPAFISLSRYTRMYVLLIPLFLLLLYSIYRSITEKIPFWLEKSLKKLPHNFFNFWQQNLNFNWTALIFTFVLLYLNFHTHINSLVALPAVALFVIFLFFMKDRQRYLFPVAAITTTIVIIIIFYDPEKFYLHNFITPFSKNNQAYLDHILNFPFAWQLTLSLNLISLLTALKKWRQHIIYIHFVLFFGIIFFIYMANRYASYVYSSHLVILAILGSLDGAWQLWKILKLQFVKIILVFLLLGTLFLQLLKINPNRYDGQGSAQHSIAYREIIENYDVEKDLLFMQYPREYYLRELNKVKIFDMKSNKSLKLEDLLKHVENNKKDGSKIWIIFESGKRGHLSAEVLSYIETNFDKIHGQGVDQTGVEVFYAEKF